MIAGGASEEDRASREKVAPREAGAKGRPVSYVNGKGRRYYLFSVETKTGKPRYVFRRGLKGAGEPVLAIPEGYEIAESVNGVVSLRMVVESLVRSEELEAVRAVLRRYKGLARHRVEEVRGDIVVFEPIGGASPELLDILERYGGISRVNMEEMDERVQYEPVLLFRLVDAETRLFHTSRMTYRREGGMKPLTDGGGTIDEVAERFCKTLGTDDFFELY